MSPVNSVCLHIWQEKKQISEIMKQLDESRIKNKKLEKDLLVSKERAILLVSLSEHMDLIEYMIGPPTRNHEHVYIGYRIKLLRNGNWNARQIIREQ